jgi:hypothetical protein
MSSNVPVCCAFLLFFQVLSLYIAIAVILVYSLFASSELPSPNRLQGALEQYIHSPSFKELMAAVEENFHKCSSLMEVDGIKLQSIVMANPFSMFHFAHATDGILTWILVVTKILSKN